MVPRPVDLAHSTGKPSEDSQWYMGVVFAGVSTIFATSGLIVSKIAHLREYELASSGERRSMCQRPMMWLGLAVMGLFPAPLDLFAAAYARFSLIAPFAGLPVIENAIAGYCILGEHIGWLEICSTALIVGGCLLTTLFGSHGGGSFVVDGCPRDELLLLHGDRFGWPNGTVCVCNAEAEDGLCCPYFVCNCVEFQHSLRQPDVIVYLCSCTSILILCAYFWIRHRPAGAGACCCCGGGDKGGRKSEIPESRRQLEVPPLPTPEDSGEHEDGDRGWDPNQGQAQEYDSDREAEARAPSGYRTPPRAQPDGKPRLAFRYSSPEPRQLRPNGKGVLGSDKRLAYVFGLMGGVCGGIQGVACKMCIELLKSQENGHDQTQYVLSYIICGIGLIATAGTALSLQCGLNYFDTVFYTPIFASFFMVFGVISSFVVFGDASTLSGSSIAIFAVGCTLTVSGTALLGRRKNLDSGRVPRCCLPTSRRGKHHELVSSKDDDEDDDIWSADPSRQKIKSSPHTGYFSPL